ncbi:MAG: response regulator [Bacteroidetes bacterium]|nr:response regulator [Bacteroidota bacterium]
MMPDLEKEKIETQKNSVLPQTLLIEDEEISRIITRMFLKDICDVDFAEDGEIGFDMAEKKNYEIIFMDIGLGRGMNGMQTAQKIKQLKQYKNTPIVALTAYAMRGDKEEFLANGCTHYVSRPVDKRKLIQLVQDMLHQL